MKSLNVKIPLSVASRMDDSGQLNPQWLSTWIEENAHKEVPEEPIKELCVNYTFKVEDDLHLQVKLIAVHRQLAMSEMIGRLLAKYY